MANPRFGKVYGGPIISPPPLQLEITNRELPVSKKVRENDMSIWKDIPYELQSPSHRNAYNHANNPDYVGWDAGLSTDMATTFLNHQERVQKIRAGEKSSVNVDGTSGFVNMISGFATAALQNMGVQSEPTQATVVPASWGNRNAAGMDNSTLMIVGLVAVGAYLAMKA